MKGKTMYIPPHFEVSDRAWILDLIERHPFGSLVTCEEESARVSHLPLIAQERQEEIWLIGHVARNNPHAQSIVAQAAATLVFRGPHAYISASWYEEPYATVPTWNYTAAHVAGRLRQYDTWDAVKLLSAKLEGRNRMRGTRSGSIHGTAIASCAGSWRSRCAPKPFTAKQS